MTARDELAALGPLVDLFDALGVEHYIGGSMASSVHGVARTTLDVDVVAALRREHVDRLVRDLGERYYVDAAQIDGAIEQRRAFNLIHFDTMYKVDVFVMRDRPFDDAARRRTVRRPLAEEGSRTFAIASPEDTILYKLEWYRAGDEASERQWSDVVGVMRVQRDRLDPEYLDRWAGELGIADLLERARGEA